MKKKVLILYTAVGMGHKSIAENIGYHLSKAGYEVLLHDILKVQEGVMTAFGIWMHGIINRYLAFIWSWLYFSNLVNILGRPLRVPLAKTNSENLLAIVEKFQPDLIISSQTTGSAATAALIQKNKYQGKFIIGFSDYHLHKFWLYEEADHYLVNIESQKSEMVALGVPAEKISVCGITLKPLVKVDKISVRNKLNVPQNHKLIIFGSGSLGIGFDFKLLVDFLSRVTESGTVSVLVMCAKNAQLKSDLENEHIPNVTALGFYDNPSELYQAADLLVTKPGGLTIAEALQADIPILVTHTLPGQEEPNYDYLLSHGWIIPKPQPLTGEQLARTSLKLLASDHRSAVDSAEIITQLGHEGKTLLSAVEKVVS